MELPLSLALETFLYSKAIEGKLFRLKIINLEDRFLEKDEFSVSVGGSEEILLIGKPLSSESGDNTEAEKFSLVYNLAFPQFYPLQLSEHSRYRIEIELSADFLREEIEIFPHLTRSIRWEPAQERSESRRGELNFRNFVGRSRFEILANGKPLFFLGFEVRSKKLNYFRDFRGILNFLTSKLPSVVFDSSGPTGLGIAPKRRSPSPSEPFPPTSLYLSLRAILLRYRWPELFRKLTPLPLSSERNLRRKKLLSSAPPPPLPSELLRAYASDYLPAPAPNWNLPPATKKSVPRYYTAPRIEVIADYTLYSNLKFIWSFVRTSLVCLKNLFKNNGEDFSEVLNWLDFWDSLPAGLRWWAGLEGREPGFFELRRILEGPFRPFGESYLLLRRGATVELGTPFSLLFSPVRSMAELYEYWAFYVLESILVGLVSERAGSVVPGGGGPIYRRRVDFFWEGVRISLFHRLRFLPGGFPYSSYSIEQIPDITVEFRRVWTFRMEGEFREGGDSPVGGAVADGRGDGEASWGGGRWLFCFDAKYRAEPELRDVHSYRDSIFGVKGCYILYPGEREGFFFRGRWEELEGVGEIPLTPRRRDINNLSSFVRLLLQKFMNSTQNKEV